tara:strand:+ start:2020 stop:2268 length:249 start_codon:yes stop_codon:yes gene_type:complete
MDTKLENYSLLNNKSSNSNLNYNHYHYNNYQSWSNVGKGIIKLWSIDKNGNTQNVNNYFSRLERLTEPTSTQTDINLSWVPK